MALFVLAWSAPACADGTTDKLVLQLHGPPQFEFAGYYAAIWNGFYTEAGLTVEIRPGAARGESSIDPVLEVVGGRAQFGTSDARLAARIGQGLPLRLLATIFQESGTLVYYRAADSDFASPRALLKVRLGLLPVSDLTNFELFSMFRANGIDLAEINAVALGPGQTVAALADHSADAAIGSAWEVPWLAREKGITLKAFNPADYQVEFYGDTLFTLQRLAEMEPKTVRSFRAASLKGWDYALQHPDEIVTRMLAELPHPAGIADASGFARYQAALAPRLARYPDIALGHSDPDRWNRIETSLIGAGMRLRTTDPNDFIYDPDAGDRSGPINRRPEIILGATGLAIITIIVVLIWLGRWRRVLATPRPSLVAAPATSATAAVPDHPPAATDLHAVPSVLRSDGQRVGDGLTHDVFISYSQQDRAVATAVCHRMEGARIRCWIAPRDIAHGTDWGASIVDAIGSVKVLVVIFSAAANASRHVLDEVSTALDAGATVIPFRIQNIRPTGGLRLHLARLHWLDALTLPLDAHIDRLIESTKRNLLATETMTGEDEHRRSE